MSCAARYSETTSLKFILNPFEIFRTVKSRRMCPRKLSIIERLEGAGQRLTMIFPTGANFRPGSRSLSHAVPAFCPNSSGRAVAATRHSPDLRPVFASSSSLSGATAYAVPLHQTHQCSAGAHPLVTICSRAHMARSYCALRRSCCEHASKRFFPFYASISPVSVTCRAFLRVCEPALTGPVGSSGFPAVIE